MSDFQSFQKDVGAWHVGHFGPLGTNYRLSMKMREEAREFADKAEALDDCPTHLPFASEEAADCLIVLCAWAERNGVDLLFEARLKLEEVKGRNQLARDIERGIVAAPTGEG